VSELVRVASVDEFPPGTMRSVEVDGFSICVVNADGEFYAVRDNCSHRDFPLSEGSLHGGATLECAWHGARFDLKTGRALRLPAIKPIKTFEVVIEDGAIKVRI
jgi:3-phenylpropionate/trans-cinnamate dioxygenase ferredoxin component